MLTLRALLKEGGPTMKRPSPYVALLAVIMLSACDDTDRRDGIASPDQGDDLRPQFVLSTAQFCCKRYLTGEEYAAIENWLFNNVAGDSFCQDLANRAFALLWAGNMRVGYGEDYEGPGSAWGSYGPGTNDITISIDHWNPGETDEWAADTLMHEAWHQWAYQTGNGDYTDEGGAISVGASCSIS